MTQPVPLYLPGSPSDPPSLQDATGHGQAADLRDEERSEDDGMREHADKAADPTIWADGAAERSERRLRLVAESTRPIRGD